MKAIDKLSDSQVLALARFIMGCARIRASSRWRAQFTDCARRGSYLPFVSPADQEQLRQLVGRHSAALVCSLRTSDLMQEGNQVALVRGEPTLEIEPLAAEATSS
jgi:hypothetical protein